MMAIVSGSSGASRRSRVDRSFRTAAARLGRRLSASATAPTTRRRRWASSPACSSRPATSRRSTIPIWVILAAHAAIGLGTLSGGWRIIHTMGSKITKLQPVGGFAAETAGAITLFLATLVRHPGLDDAHHHRRDRRRRRDAAALRRPLGRRRPHRLGLDPDHPDGRVHGRTDVLGGGGVRREVAFILAPVNETISTRRRTARIRPAARHRRALDRGLPSRSASLRKAAMRMTRGAASTKRSQLWFESCIERGTLERALQESNFRPCMPPKAISEEQNGADGLLGEPFIVRVAIPAYQAIA